MRSRALLPLLAVACAVGTIGATSAPARGDESPRAAEASFALLVNGAHAGYVRSLEGEPAGHDGISLVTMKFDTVTPSVAMLVGAWLDGKAPRPEMSLASAAVLRKMKEPRVASVRLPALGFGAPEPLEIVVETKGISSAPSFRLATDRVVAQGARMGAFRVDVAGRPTQVSKLGELVLHRGATVDILLEVPAGEVKQWSTWAKAPAPRPLRVDYSADDDKALLRLALDGCRPTSVKPTNGPTTRVALTCAAARSGP